MDLDTVVSFRVVLTILLSNTISSSRSIDISLRGLENLFQIQLKNRKVPHWRNCMMTS